MKYLKVNEALVVVAISNDMPDELRKYDPEIECPWWRKADGTHGAGWLNCNDIDSFMLAQVLADSASQFAPSNDYMAIDRGPDTSSRYDVIEKPTTGDEVSMAFNGDFYPIGKIKAISASMKQITVDGPRGIMKFYRRKLSGSWLFDGMWSLVPGAISKWNPEF